MLERSDSNTPSIDTRVGSVVPENWNESARSVLDHIGFTFKTPEALRTFIVQEFGGGKVTLDAGSGYEHFASDVLGVLAELHSTGRVINLNPALSTKFREDPQFKIVRREDGTTHTIRIPDTGISQSVEAAVRVANLFKKHEQQFYGTELPSDLPESTLLPRESVAGLLQRLPLADDSLDRIISSFYFPGFLITHEKRDEGIYSTEEKEAIPGIIVASLEEMARCLKHDGKIYLNAQRGQREVFEKYVELYREKNKGNNKRLSLKPLLQRDIQMRNPDNMPISRYELYFEQQHPKPETTTRQKNTGSGIARLLRRT